MQLPIELYFVIIRYIDIQKAYELSLTSKYFNEAVRGYYNKELITFLPGVLETKRYLAIDYILFTCGKWSKLSPADQEQLFRWSVLHNQLKIFKALSHVDPNLSNGYALRISTAKYYPDIVKELLLHPNIDVTANNYQALTLATAYQYTDIMEMLLKCPEIDPNVPFLSMDEKLLLLVDVKVLGILWSHKDIDKSACINSLMDKQPLLCIKFMSEIGGFDDIVLNDVSDDIVRQVIVQWNPDYNINVLEKIISNWGDVRLCTLLEHAIRKGIVEVVKILLDKIVELDINMRWMLNGHNDIVKMLLSDDRIRKLLEDDDYTTKKLEERNMKDKTTPLT